MMGGRSSRSRGAMTRMASATLFLVMAVPSCFPSSLPRMQPPLGGLRHQPPAVLRGEGEMFGRGPVAEGLQYGVDKEDVAIADSDAEELKQLLDNLDEAQVHTAKAIEALHRQSEETERLTDLLSTALYGDGRLEAQGSLHERARELQSRVAEDGGMVFSGNGQDMEIGSTPMRGDSLAGEASGGGQGEAGLNIGLRGGGREEQGDDEIDDVLMAVCSATAGEQGARAMSLRGGGNGMSAPKVDDSKAPKKYTREQHKVNKQMCKAVQQGDEEAVKKLLKSGANPTYRYCGPLEYSVMHHAINLKQFKIFEYLASHGGDVHQRCALGWTLLHQAAYIGELEACEKLIKMGVDITVKNNARRTAPQVAKTNGHKACSQALWAIQEEAEVKKGGHAPAGVPVDNPEDDEVDEEDSEKEREEEAKAAAAAGGKPTKGH